jgi:hypothetical protein
MAGAFMALQNMAIGGMIGTMPAAIRAPVGSMGQRLRRTIAKWARDVSDPYRPELHYMRGPGPKWREKHIFAALNERGPR